MPRYTCQAVPPACPFGRRSTLDFEWKWYFWVWIYLYRYWIRRYTFIIETNRLTERGARPLILSNIDRFAPNLPKSARFGDFESDFAPVMHYLIKQKDKRSTALWKYRSKIRWWQRWSNRLRTWIFGPSEDHRRLISGSSVQFLYPGRFSPDFLSIVTAELKVSWKVIGSRESVMTRESVIIWISV